jgi:hypothetical protein
MLIELFKIHPTDGIIPAILLSSLRGTKWITGSDWLCSCSIAKAAASGRNDGAPLTA